MSGLKNFIMQALKAFLLLFVIMVVGLFLLLAICNCDVPNYTLIDYYKNDADFINVIATVDRISYSEEFECISIHFSGLSQRFASGSFYIPMDYASEEIQTNILEKIKVGDKVKFTTDPWYYGDGYIMPIVAIWSPDGEPILEYEEGYANLMAHLRD